MSLRLPQWTEEKSIAFMDRHGVRRAIVSIGHPLHMFAASKDEARSLCREMNEYMASLRDRNPSRFGFFATVPTPGEHDACISEIQYAMTVLKADGVLLFTSYEGAYLGDPGFKAVWKELNQHKANVFTHPGLDKHKDCIGEPRPIPRPIIDWTHETTRTAVHILAANILREFAECKVILPHAGGTLPFTFHRFVQLATARYLSRTPEEMQTDARRFYFDVALSIHEGPFRLLEQFAGRERLLYGSDFPFAPENAITSQRGLLDTFTDNDAPIRVQNALEILPDWT